MKRKTNIEKKQQGTYRPDRDTGVKIDPLSKMPQPDPRLSLSKDATDLWYSYGTQLIINGLLTFLDLITLGRYCQLFDEASAMKKDIKEGGYFQTTQSGYEQIRPCVGLLRTIESEMLKIEDRFGLNPASRAKIPGSPPLDDNPFKQLMKE